MRIGSSKKFTKQYEKLPRHIHTKFEKRIELFIQNPRNEILRIHKLHGKLEGLHSINVTGDIRAVFEYVNTDKVEFVSIGSHSELYS